MLSQFVLSLNSNSNTLHPFTQSILISLVIGLLASVSVWGLIKLWRIIFKSK